MCLECVANEVRVIERGVTGSGKITESKVDIPILAGGTKHNCPNNGYRSDTVCLSESPSEAEGSIEAEKITI